MINTNYYKVSLVTTLVQTCNLISIFHGRHTHGNKLSITLAISRVNFRPKFSYILKMFHQSFSNNTNLYYPRLLLRLNDKYSANHVVNSGHIKYRKSVSDFITKLIYQVIRSFHEVSSS